MEHAQEHRQTRLIIITIGHLLTFKHQHLYQLYSNVFKKAWTSATLPLR